MTCPLTVLPTSTPHRTFSHHHSPSFFFNATATTEIYTLSLHDALPISHAQIRLHDRRRAGAGSPLLLGQGRLCDERDRKSTRLNSSHMSISYAVFCLKKKKKKKKHMIRDKSIL